MTTRARSTSGAVGEGEHTSAGAPGAQLEGAVLDGRPGDQMQQVLVVQPCDGAPVDDGQQTTSPVGGDGLAVEGDVQDDRPGGGGRGGVDVLGVELLRDGSGRGELEVLEAPVTEPSSPILSRSCGPS